jgi:hypothetical protein
MDLLDIDFARIYKRDKELIDRCIPQDVIARLLGRKDMILQNEYNKLLRQEKRLAEYIDNEDIPIESRERESKRYGAILDRLNIILAELEKLGVSVSDSQIENGF